MNRDCSIDLPFWYKSSIVIVSRAIQPGTGADDTKKSLQQFFAAIKTTRKIDTKNYLKFTFACEDLNWNRDKSIPHRSGPNGIAERAVRRVNEGTASVVMQSSLTDGWWSAAVGSCCSCMRSDQNAPLNALSYRSEQTFPATHLSKEQISPSSVRQEDVGWHVHEVCPTNVGWMERRFAYRRLGRT